MAHDAHSTTQAAAHSEGVQHPIKIYLWIWALLFVFSTASYFTDFIPRGPLRWGLILTFMLLKAGFIVAIFMHMAWERLALKIAILAPPIALLVLIGLMAIEGDYTHATRAVSFILPPDKQATHEGAPQASHEPAPAH